MDINFTKEQLDEVAKIYEENRDEFMYWTRAEGKEHLREVFKQDAAIGYSDREFTYILLSKFAEWKMVKHI